MDSPVDMGGEDALREGFVRNVGNCQLVIANDFEAVLADIIEQFEQPLHAEGRVLTALETAQLIADAMREGFAGLHPNGIEFACWLWDVAPLHVVQLPDSAGGPPMQGFRHGVVHLRRIASMIAGVYVAQQPQRADMVIELLDSSMDWVDARNLVMYALVDYFEEHVGQELGSLLVLAGGKKNWRRMLPLGTAARLMARGENESALAFRLVHAALPHLSEASTFQAVLYVMRVAAMYGDQRSILAFLDGLRQSTHAEASRLFCEVLRNPHLRWEQVSSEELRAAFLRWMEECSDEQRECVKRAWERIEA